MLVEVDVFVYGGIVDSPLAILEEGLQFFLSGFKVVVPILSELLAVVKPGWVIAVVLIILWQSTKRAMVDIYYSQYQITYSLIKVGSRTKGNVSLH